jgi:glycosyltransferase involved in cell wall biosynthesis
MKVSVITPCTDRTVGLRRCLESALNQDYNGELEVILVENNSQDRSVITDLVSSINNINIKHYYLDSCANANVARNFGANKSQAEYVAYLDSDDFWLPNHLSKGIVCFEADVEVSAIYSGYILNDGIKDKQIYSRPISKETGYSFLFGSNPGVAQTSSYIVKKELNDLIQWDEELSRSQDYDFFVSVQLAVGWDYNPEMSVVVVWALGEKRKFSVDAFKFFYHKHEKNMLVGEKAGYVSRVLRALSQKTKADYLEFFPIGVGLRSSMGFPGYLYSYGYYSAKFTLWLRTFFSKNT